MSLLEFLEFLQKHDDKLVGENYCLTEDARAELDNFVSLAKLGLIK